MPVKPPSRRDLRVFGLVLAALLAVVGSIPLLRGEAVRLWAEIAALTMLAPALAAPRLLWPLHWLFLRIGLVLGWINTRILLGTMFYLVITPIGLARRLMWGHARQHSFWHAREPVDQTKQMERPF
jgi:hypothetical protein